MYRITAAILMLLACSTGIHAQDELPNKESHEQSALDKRINIERRTLYESFVITPHKPNYILPIAYNDTPNYDPNNTGTSSDLDKNEVKFQMSMKFPITEDLFGEEGSLFFAYTNLSFWQAYNEDTSRPFRETNHEPELFLIFPVEFEVLGMRNRLIQLGIIHQSNGRSEPESRSWNRLYLDFVFQRKDLYLSIKPWVRLTGSAKDDNPDIQDFLGHGEIRGVYSNGYHTVSLMLRNNLSSPNYGAVELNWSFPMSRRAKWFVQYFNGYGESLIDYNAKVNRLGIGIAFTDWL
jgi:phospholipase A1